MVFCNPKISLQISLSGSKYEKIIKIQNWKTLWNGKKNKVDMVGQTYQELTLLWGQPKECEHFLFVAIRVSQFCPKRIEKRKKFYLTSSNVGNLVVYVYHIKVWGQYEDMVNVALLAEFAY